MSGVDNLIPIPEMPEDVRKEFHRKGGVASGKARREKANFRKLLEIALNEEYKGGMTNAEAMVVSIIQEALEGNTKAFEVVRDTIGQKPVEKAEEKITGGLQVVWGEPK